MHAHIQNAIGNFWRPVDPAIHLYARKRQMYREIVNRLIEKCSGKEGWEVEKEVSVLGHIWPRLPCSHLFTAALCTRCDFSIAKETKVQRGFGTSPRS